MYERGEREPGLEMIETFADFFNVDLDYLLGKSDIPNKILSMNALSIKYNKLNTLGQQKTDEYIDDLLKVPEYTLPDDINIAAENQYSAHADDDLDDIEHT